MIRLGKIRPSRIVFLGLLACASVPAATVDLGEIVLLGGTPLAGLQQLQLFNLTGAVNCGAVYEVCNGINITNWSLSVTYTNGVSPNTSTANFAETATDIAPYSSGSGFSGESGAQWTFSQACDISPFTCPPYDVEITSLTFTGHLSDTHLKLYSGGGPLTDFFAASQFTTVFVPLSDQGGTPDQFGPNSFSVAELMVSDASSGGGGGNPPGVPEPASLLLLLFGVGGLALLGGRRRHAKSGF